MSLTTVPQTSTTSANTEGGPIDHNDTTNGLCSSNSRAMYTYTPEKNKEAIEFTVNLLSRKNSVTFTVTYENTDCGTY